MGVATPLTRPWVCGAAPLTLGFLVLSVLKVVPWGGSGHRRRCCCDDESLAGIIAFLSHGGILLLELAHHSFEALEAIVLRLHGMFSTSHDASRWLERAVALTVGVP